MLKKTLAFLMVLAVMVAALSVTVLAEPKANGKLKVDFYDLGPESEETYGKLRALRDEGKLAELLDQDWVTFVKSGELSQVGETSGHGLLFMSKDTMTAIIKANIPGKQEGGEFPNSFALVITGYLIPKESGTYNFRLWSDDSSRLKVGDKWVVSTWGEPEGDGRTWEQERISEDIQLEAGKVYPIRAEYFEGWGGHMMEFQWRKDGGDWTPIPTDVLASEVEGYEDPGSEKPSPTSDVSMLLPMLMAGAAVLGGLKLRKK